MKILKKIGLGCLALVICFCSCFKFVNAFQTDFVFDTDGPIYQSYIGSIDFGVGYEGLGHTNENIPLQTNFYLPDSLETDTLVTATKDFGVYNKFVYKDPLQSYFVTQSVTFSNSRNIQFFIHFSDIFVYQNYEGDLPTLIIDNGRINAEQGYSFTYDCTYFNSTTLSLDDFEETQPIQLITEDSRYYSYSLENLFKDIVRNESLNTENSHGGLGFIKDITLTISMLDHIDSNYPVTVSIEDMRIDPYEYNYAYDEFHSALIDYETPGIFGWLLKSINAFMTAELFPNFSIGVLLGTIVAIPLLIYILRLFMGG